MDALTFSKIDKGTLMYGIRKYFNDMFQNFTLKLFINDFSFTNATTVFAARLVK